MRTVSRPWKDRLPSAFAALAVQAALFLLLLQSFQPARRRDDDSGERIFYLPRILERQPPVIDARPLPRAPSAPSTAPAVPAPEIPPAPPPYTQPAPGNPGLLTALGRALACEPDAHGRASPLLSCRVPQRAGRNEMAALAPALPVKREDELAAERAEANTPGQVPCVSMQSRKIVFGGTQEHTLRVSVLCALGELMR